jgi:DNA repair exonuclease SbcCD ATPase subunit
MDKQSAETLPLILKTETMKYIATLALIGLFFTACDTAELDQRIAELESANEELARQSAEKDSVLVAFDETFATISRNLAMIRESEESIRLESSNIELSGDQRAAIEQEIQDINALLKANKDQIASLNSTISKYKGEVSKYKGIIDGLERQIEEKNQQIEDLKQNLVAANFTIEILNKMNEELANEIRTSQGKIERLTEDKNTVYYVMGTFKELKEMGIAERAGIMAGKKMVQDFNRDDFVEIDLREVTTISLSSDKAEVLSPHPAGSYELHGAEEEEHRLVIVNPELFWSTTNYLIIEIK